MNPGYTGPVPCGRCRIALPAEVDGEAACVCGSVQQVLRFAPRRGPAPSPAAAALASGETPCAYHVRNIATQACRRCGSFICDLCSLALGQDRYCPACFDRMRRADQLDPLRSRFGRPHAQALALGTLALFPCAGALLAPAAIWLGARSLGRRQELSQREPHVALLAVGGLVLGTLSILMHGALLYFSIKSSGS